VDAELHLQQYSRVPQSQAKSAALWKIEVTRQEISVSHRPQRGTTLLLSLLLVIPTLVHAAAGCKLNRLASLPVTMDGLRPTVEAQINGSPALFTLDSGAFWSMLSPASAQQYALRLDYNRVPGLYVQGIGGNAGVAVTTVKTFTVFNVPLHNMDFIVGGSEPGKGTVGLLGQNILRIADVEYDLAQGSLALFKPENCKHVDLVYWAKPGDAYSVMDIEETTPIEPHTTGRVILNGAKVRVQFDTGAATSIVGLRAAASAGLKPGNPGVEPAGYSTGIGRKMVQTWIATFPVLKIGDEEIRNARLQFGDLGDFDMLLGDDFFLSHRVYVANSQHKLYFTYNGGPVFALNARRKAPAAAAAVKPATEGDTAPTDTAKSSAESSAEPPSAKANGGSPSDDTETSPANAADLARRAAAFAARRDFEHALQDFNRACELAPGEPGYHYQRALVEFSLRQPEPASNDLDRALTLKPDYVDALVTRAEYRRSKRDMAAALADLDAADRVATKEADVRLKLAMLYGGLDHPAQAITQADLWIAIHEQDPRVFQAYNERCWARAVLGKELDQALRDCNAGLRLNPHAPKLLDSRGLVNLRRNQFDKAIADYNEALKINPKIAWSLYGRGLAELRKGMTAQGDADIAAAKAVAPHLPEFAQRIGVSP
jgi:tetratricopeptide (TPR) repeat protein/predicted aspartyl protease